MGIHGIALETFDRLMARAEENRRSHGEWWEEANYIHHEPTLPELEAKAASVQRRLEKAEAAWVELLSDDERADHAFMKTEPRSMDDVERRKRILNKTYLAVDADKNKLARYCGWQKLKNQLSDLQSQIRHHAGESEEMEERDESRISLLTIDWPDSVESAQQASAVINLLGRALEDAGYGYAQLGIAMPVAYFDAGKLSLELNDNEERFRFNRDDLNEIDWEKVRESLVALKAEVESPAGWRRMPAAGGEIWEKTAPMDNLQIRLLRELEILDWNDVSHWDTWQPPLPGRLASEPFSIEPASPGGESVDWRDIPRVEIPKEREAWQEVPENEGTEYLLDTDGLHMKATVQGHAAQHLLKDYLGIGGLELPGRDAAARGR